MDSSYILSSWRPACELYYECFPSLGLSFFMKADNSINNFYEFRFHGLEI